MSGNEDRAVKEVQKMFDAIQAVNEEETKNNSTGLTNERVDNAILKMQEGVEQMRSDGENIVSRYRAGLIGKDVAQSRMRDLLTKKCEELLGLTMHARGIDPNMKVNEEQIREALGKVTASLS